MLYLQFEKVAKCYGEDPKKCQPEEFFGVFSTFVTSFLDAKIDNDRFLKQKEEEEKRARMETMVSACCMKLGDLWEVQQWKKDACKSICPCLWLQRRAEKEKRANKLNITRSKTSKGSSGQADEEKGNFFIDFDQGCLMWDEVFHWTLDLNLSLQASLMTWFRPCEQGMFLEMTWPS